MFARGLWSNGCAGILLVLVAIVAGCDGTDSPSKVWTQVCIDLDGDGFGLHCAQGADCDDQNAQINAGCGQCSSPLNEGCGCTTESETTSCVNSRSVNDQGALVCELGTRTCRDGAWSACENLTTREVPAQSALLYRAIIDPDAAAAKCDPCHPDCYKVDDPLGEFDGTIGDNIVSVNGGGVTIYSAIEDGGVAPYDAGFSDACVPGIAPDRDCDGIPDQYDPFPGAAPFASTHHTIFMELTPGEKEASDFDIRFALNTADIYFFVDMTASMDGERTNLLDSFLTGNYLPDGGVGIECADRNQNGSAADEEVLKEKGIVGNLACIVRDSWLGAGWFRDLPFGSLDTDGFAYGPDDFETFQNEVDLSSNENTVFEALNRFRTRGGINRPEGGIMGIHMIATGDEMYLGWDRPGNPKRTTCPTGRWGYPCFRKDAVPIIVYVTDAPSTNGPAPLENTLGPAKNFFFTGVVVDQKVNWPVANVRIDTGTGGTYYDVQTKNDSYATAYDIGDINDSFRTFTGDTTGFSGAMTTQLAGACLGGTSRSKGPLAWSDVQQGAPNAFYKFHVSVEEPLVISTRGGHVKSSIAIVDAARSTQVATPYFISTNANSTSANALDLGTINPKTGTAIVSGTASGATALFTRDTVGTCLAQNTASTDRLAASLVKFRLAEDLPQGLRVTADGAFNIAAAVYEGTPNPPVDLALTSVNVIPGPASAGATSGGNANDVFDSYNIGDLVGRSVRLTSGTTNTANLTSNFAKEFFQVSPSCAVVETGGKDAVVDFVLSAPKRVRIEGAGNNATLTAGFDHAIALVKREAVTHAALTNNYTDATAAPILLTEVPTGATGGSEFAGVLGGTPADYQQSEVGPVATASAATACVNAAAAASTTSEAVHVINVTNATAGSYDFETGGSAASTWISLHKTMADSQSIVTPTNPLLAGQVQDLGRLAAQRSYLVTGATMVGHGTNALDFVTRGNLGCAASPLAAGGSDAIYSFQTDTLRAMRVSTVGGTAAATPTAPGVPGFNSQIAVYAGLISPATLVAGGCDDPAGTNAYTTADFMANPLVNYIVVVKYISTTSTNLTGGTALYGLWLRDPTYSDNFVSCNYGSQVNYPSTVRASRITANLTAGRYYVVVKGTAASNYKLTVRRTTTSVPTALACDRNGIATGRSVIEANLAAGEYAVIIRGVTATDVGTYNLLMRDTSYAAVSLACSYDGNAGEPTAATTGPLVAQRNGTPVDYYAMVRGNTSSLAYTMYFENNALKPTECAFDNCNWYHNDPNTGTLKYTYDVNNGEWTGSLKPGDYYAIIKGEDETDVATNTEDDDFGRYQLSIGDAANFTGTGDMAQKTWLGPSGNGVGGVRKELLDKGIRLVTVDSTRGPDDDPAVTDDPYYSNQQMSTMAKETNATRADGTPLYFNINRDGTGLGTAIVRGIQELSGNLAMNVTARLVTTPDSPAPQAFGFTVLAVDMPGDSCDPPIDTDGDAAHLPDTHVACKPGATPKFRVTFSNPPAPNNVRPNMKSPSDPAYDPNGGYNMRIELIGDNQYVVDSVPVYIIVENVIADPTDPLFAASGKYTQDTPASGCSGTEAPLWSSLSWEDTMPLNTSLRWEICTAATSAALDTCSYRTLANVTRGRECVTSASCPGGFCAPGGYCEYVAGPTCSVSGDCGPSGACVANKCVWTSTNIDLKPALTNGAQGERFLRSRLTLNANPTRTQAPTVHTWGVKYTCTPQE